MTLACEHNTSFFVEANQSKCYILAYRKRCCSRALNHFLGLKKRRKKAYISCAIHLLAALIYTLLYGLAHHFTKRVLQKLRCDLKKALAHYKRNRTEHIRSMVSAIVWSFTYTPSYCLYNRPDILRRLSLLVRPKRVNNLKAMNRIVLKNKSCEDIQ